MIKIGCGDDTTLGTQLFDILSRLERRHHALKWRVSEFCGTAKQRDGKIFKDLNVLDLEEKTGHGQSLEFKFEEILSIADKISQTFDIDLIGLSEAGEKPRVIIHCFDSSYWTIEICDPVRREADLMVLLQTLHPEDVFTLLKSEGPQ